jgi:hypothetical protein
VSGKSNLTFEEALVSEHNVTEKAQKLPTELMVHILRMTQYSKSHFYFFIMSNGIWIVHFHLL